MKLKYIGILRRDGSAPVINDGDNVIKADSKHVADVPAKLVDALIETGLWQKEGNKQDSEKEVLVSVEVQEGTALVEPEVAAEISSIEQDSEKEVSDQDKAALLEYAKSLGIKANGTWGVAKLNAAIAEAQAE